MHLMVGITLRGTTLGQHILTKRWNWIPKEKRSELLIESPSIWSDTISVEPFRKK